ncbi:MAG: GDSL-type esterase/lipase family protein [Ilumatobacteraceae bacterium]
MSDATIDPRRGRAPSRSPRVSRRRYLVRRAVAVGMVVGAGFGAARVAGLVADGEDEPIDAVPITAATLAPIGAATGGGAAGLGGSTTTLKSVPDRAEARPPASPRSTVAEPVVTTAETTTTTTTAPETTPVPTVPPPPTADDPGRVLVIGDSFAGLWGPPLESMLEETGVVQVEVDHEASTGLARPRRYDWFGRAGEQLAAVAPDVVVTSFGGNDFVPLGDLDGAQIVGDPLANEAEWFVEYQRRAGEMMDLLAQDGRTVIWVGTANHPDPTTSAGLAVQDRAAKAAAAERPHVVLIDTWNLFAGRSGGWAPYVLDPRTNTGVDVRIEDGFHPNAEGAEILAAQIDPAVRAALHL